jgi:MFS transporter, DHA2 family, multidrug resistance protein
MQLQLPEWKQKVLFISIILSIGMEVLDVSITNVSIVYIAGDLAVPPYIGTWIISGYSVGNSIMLILAGFFGRYFGTLITYRTSIILFTLFSALCGLAPSFPFLILFRALQGMSAGPMIPLANTILLSAYPPEKRKTMIAIQSVTIVAAPLLGPVLGGIISEYLGWRWIFYVNVPIGIFCLLLNFYVFDIIKEKLDRIPLDFLGLFLIVSGVFCLQYSLDRGEQLQWFASKQIIFCLSYACVSLSIFIPWTYYSDHPIVNLHLLKQRNFLICFICVLLTSIEIYGLLVLFPIWLQTNLNYTASQAGVVMIPFAAAIFVITPLVNYISDKLKIKEKFFATCGFLLFFYAFFLFTKLNTNVGMGNLFNLCFLVGACVGLFFVPVNTIAYSYLDSKELPHGTSLISFIRTIGMGIGSSSAISIMQYRQKAHLHIISDSISDSRVAVQEWILKLERIGYKGASGLGWIFEQTVKQTYMLAVNDFYFFMSFLFLILSFLILLTKKPNQKKDENKISI